METQSISSRNPWKIMLTVNILFLAWTLFVMSRGTQILPTAFKLAGSPQLTEDIEKNALAFMNMSMLKPLWEGIWAGIFGLYIAFSLKRRKKYAWKLGLFWGIMLLTNAAIQGTYELIVLNWSNVCLQTYIFLVLGLAALIGILYTRKDYLGNVFK